MSAAEDKPDGYQQQFEDVTSTLRIAAILRPLQRQHSIVSVAIPGAQRLYNSTLLAVDADSGQLLLDQLHPPEGHALLSPGSRVGITARREGTEVRLILDITDIGREGGSAFYRAPFPASVRYRQRRKAYRATVSAALSIRVEIADASGEHAICGELHDISAEGMCVRLPAKSALPDEQSEAFIATLILPGKKRVQSRFRVLHTLPHEASRTLQVGGHFEAVDKATARAIERFVLELQREHRRRERRFRAD